MGRCLGRVVGDCFTEDLSEFRQIYLRIRVFVRLIMLESNTLVSYSPKLSYDPAHVTLILFEYSKNITFRNLAVSIPFFRFIAALHFYPNPPIEDF
ncbi:hypothetical protein [Leptospira weilii]|nr:hypothetical protein [Leptospira weilii]